MEVARAAFFVGPREIRVGPIDLPRVEPGMVLLRVLACGVCGTNLHSWQAPRLTTGRNPDAGASGHEVAGQVVEVGAGVTSVRVGDRVGVELFESRACGRCRYCHEGRFFHCEQKRPTNAGGFVDYILMYDKGLYKLPESMSAAEGTLLEPFSCSLHAVRMAGLLGGETVLVLGAGLLGIFAVAAAKLYGAGKVICTAKYHFQAEAAARFGADLVVDSSDPQLERRVKDEAGGRGPDVVIESVGGRASTIQQAMSVVRPVGKVMVMGLFDEPVPIDTWQAVIKELSLIFPATYSVMGMRHEYELALELLASGKVPGKELISHRFGLGEVQRAFEVAADRSRGVFRVVVEPPLG
ncbi:MAG: alcohol dehydrogenase catalytic domain-containing protein [Chloroflexi bacterium]|nr:alcohol dehydrogenase catalytic domain-containing protein [Chloroflexota bacterium]